MSDPIRAESPSTSGARRTDPEATATAARGEAIDHDEIAALRAIVEGTARSTGDAFFQSLVRHLASAMGVSYAFVAEFAGARCGPGPSRSGARGRSGTTSNSTWPAPPART